MNASHPILKTLGTTRDFCMQGSFSVSFKVSSKLYSANEQDQD